MKGDMNTRHFKTFWQMESINQRDGSFGHCAFLVKLFVSLCDRNKWL